MDADEECWYPRPQPICRKSLRRRCEADAASRGERGEEPPGLLHTVHTHVHQVPLTQTARRFTDCEAHHQCHHYPWQAHNEERCPPAEGIVDPPTQPKPQTYTDVDPAGDQRERSSAFLRREVVRDQRLGRW